MFCQENSKVFILKSISSIPIGGIESVIYFSFFPCLYQTKRPWHGTCITEPETLTQPHNLRTTLEK